MSRFECNQDPLALAYPRWIPGEHVPTGPIENFAALRVRSGDVTLHWTRDPQDINTIRIDVPPNTNTVTVDFDTLLENTISDHQALLAWNTVILYPRGIDKRELLIEPSILLPPNWKQGSSLSVTHQAGGRVTFAATSLERLIDSPVLAGEFFRAVPLASKWPAELDFTGDSESAIDNADDAHAFALFGKLIDQDQAMFGFRHWKRCTCLSRRATRFPTTDWNMRTLHTTPSLMRAFLRLMTTFQIFDSAMPSQSQPQNKSQKSA